MHALAPVPVELMPTGQAAASSPSTGQEGLFASHLKTASQSKGMVTDRQSDNTVQGTEIPTAGETAGNAAAPPVALADNGGRSAVATDNEISEKEANQVSNSGGGQFSAEAVLLQGTAWPEPNPRSIAQSLAESLGTTIPDAHERISAGRVRESTVGRMLQGLSQDPSPFQTAASTSATVSQKDGTASTSGPLPAQHIGPDANTSPISSTTAALLGLQSAGNSNASAAAIGLSRRGQTSGFLPAQHIGPDANTSPISSTTAALLGLQSAGNSNASAAAIGLSRGGQTSGPLPAQRTGPDTNTSPIQLGAGILPDAANQTGAAQPNGPQMIQNQYGQVITIYQGTGNEEEAGVSGSPGTTTAAGTESKNLDFKNNYIHSHLPNEAPQNAAAQGESRQTDNSALDQQPEISNALNTETDAAATMESLQPQKGPMTFGQDNLPFMVSPQRPTSQPGFTHAAMEPPMYRLPSGTVVPEGTVVEQMVAHLSVNKRLETGTVNLRLHPQELGELRLEIKVEQDNIKAHIVAQNPQAQEMIDRHLPRLREALEQQGLNLQQVEVTVAANDNTRGEQFQENSTWQQPSRSPRNRMDARFTLEMDENFPKEPEATTSNLSVVA